MNISAVIGLVAIVSCIMLVKESIKYQFNKTNEKKKELKKLAVIFGVSAAITGVTMSVNHHLNATVRDRLVNQAIENNASDEDASDSE